MNRKQSGVTIFEILIALLIGSIVIAGAVTVLSNTIRKERLLSAEAEIQETLSYANSRLSFIFKEALSSPCGNLENMLANNNNSTVSKLKNALLGGSPQPINIVLQDSASRSVTIRQNEFPMLMPGIAGAENAAGASIEPLDSNGNPFSQSLPNIVAGTEYLITMELSEKAIIIPDASKALTEIVNGVGGGQNTGGMMTGLTAIPTSTLTAGVGTTRVPFVITDCNQADIFKANASVTANSIPVANNLAFHAYYKPNESIISPVNFFAYYIANENGAHQFRRRNLNLDVPPATAPGGTPPPASLAASQTLVEGIRELKFEWGLGTPESARAQAYFTTQDILNEADSIGIFRRNVISVRVTMSAQAQNNAYLDREMEHKDGVTTVTQKQRTRQATRTYTIRNKMLRI